MTAMSWILISRIDEQKDSSVLDPTWVTTKQLAQHLTIKLKPVIAEALFVRLADKKAIL